MLEASCGGAAVIESSCSENAAQHNRREPGHPVLPYLPIPAMSNFDMLERIGLTRSALGVLVPRMYSPNAGSVRASPIVSTSREPVGSTSTLLVASSRGEVMILGRGERI